MSCSYLWTRGFSDFWALTIWVSLWSLCSKSLSPTVFCETTIQIPYFQSLFFSMSKTRGPTRPPHPTNRNRGNASAKSGSWAPFVPPASLEMQCAGSIKRLQASPGDACGWRLVWLEVGWLFGWLILEKAFWTGIEPLWQVFFCFFCFFLGAPWIFLRKQRCFKFQASDFFFNNCSCILPLKGAKSWQVVSTSIKCSKGGVIIMLVFGCRGWTFFDFGGLLLLDRPSGWLYRCRRSQLVVGNKWWKVAIMAVNWAKSLRLTPTYLLSVLQTLQISEKHWKTFPHVILL